ncbi:MAG: hypothetical protein Tsb0034_09240 [Ekhidna sp.]
MLFCISAEANFPRTSPFNTPTVLSVEVPTNANYTLGSELEFVINFSEPVNVTGTPLLELILNSGTVTAEYSDGSGSASLTFMYTVQIGDEDTNGIEIGSLLTNGGTIQDFGGDDASLTLNNVENSAGILIDGIIPVVTSVSVPLDDTYIEAEDLNFTVTFNDNVLVLGNPQLNLDIGGITVSADYSGATFGTDHSFTYTVQSGELDLDGIEVQNLSLNGGSIRDVNGNSADLTLNNVAPTTGVLVDARGPNITSINGPADGLYGIDEVLNFTVNFDEPVNVTGDPTLNISMTSGTVAASFTGGSGTASLTFSYTVQEGDEDSDGITVSSLTPGGGLQDDQGNDANLALNNVDDLSAVIVDGIRPVVTSVNAPADDTYGVDADLNFIVNFDEIVNLVGSPALSITIGSTVVAATFTGGSGTSSLTFTYTVQATDNDSDGIEIGTLSLNGGSIKDNAGNDAILDLNNVDDTSDVLVDSIIATITSVTALPDGLYGIGDVLTFEVNYSEPVLVTGNPQLSFIIGSITVEADFAGGSNSSTLTFSYTVVAGDNDTDGIQITSLGLNGGSITDLSLNDADLTLNNIANTSGVLVDGIAPFVTSVDVPSDGTYGAGQTLVFTVNFNEDVTVSGTPQLDLAIEAANVNPTLTGGSGSSSLTFTYTVQNGQQDLDGIALGAAIDLNGGAIVDQADNDANLTLNSAGNTDDVLVDAVAPVITSVNVPADNTYIIDEVLTFDVNFDKAVNVSGTPILSIILESPTVDASYVSGTGTSSLLFSYNVSEGDEDTDGIQLGALTLNGGTIQDDFGNVADLTLNAVGSTTGVLVDGIVPVVTSVDVPGDGTYLEGEDLDFTVNFDDIVVVTASPQLFITIGSTTVPASFTGGSNTMSLDFTYTIQAGDDDLNGIEVNALDLNGGTIQDVAGNDADLTLNMVGDASDVLVDAVHPQVVISSPSNDPTNDDPIVIDVTFSEPVTGFISTELVITGGTLSNFTGSDASYSFDLSPSMDGTITIDIPADVAFDDAGNGNLASSQFTIESDQTAPTGYSVAFDALLYSQANENAASFTFSAAEVDADYQFSITSSGGAGTVTGSGTISDASQIIAGIDISSLPDGDLLLSVTLTDPAGNEGAPATFGDSDKNATPPTITADQVFSIDENSANGTSVGTVIAVDPNAAPLQDWTIVGGNEDGVFSINASTGELTILDNTALDFETNPTFNLSVTVSNGLNTSPAENVIINLNDLNDNLPVITPSQAFTFTSEDNIGTSIGLVVATDADAGTTFSNWSIVGGNDNNFFAINASTGELTINATGINDVLFTLQITVSDGTNTSAPEDVILMEGDQIPPNVVLSRNFTGDTNVQSHIITATFSEVVNDFDLSDIQTTNGSVSNLNTGNNQTFTFNFTASNEGTVSVSIPEAVVTDNAGNPNTGSNTISYTYDITPPSVVITSSVGSPSNALSATLTLEFSEEVTDLTLSDLQGNNSIFSNLSGSGTTYTVTSVSNEGTAEFILVNGAVSDAAGNLNRETRLTRIIDLTPPTGYQVTILNSAINTLNQDDLQFQITDAEEDATFEYTIETVSGSGTITSPSFEIVSGIDVTELSDGTLTVSLTLTDQAGNTGDPVTDEVIKNTQEEIPQGFNPNRETWQIPGIEKYPNNKVVIFNRFGNTLWKIEGYNNQDKSWDGNSNVTGVVGGGGAPDGTYFYVLEFLDDALPTKNGFVIIKRR